MAPISEELYIMIRKETMAIQLNQFCMDLPMLVSMIIGVLVVRTTYLLKMTMHTFLHPKGSSAQLFSRIHGVILRVVAQVEWNVLAMVI